MSIASYQQHNLGLMCTLPMTLYHSSTAKRNAVLKNVNTAAAAGGNAVSAPLAVGNG